MAKSTVTCATLTAVQSLVNAEYDASEAFDMAATERDQILLGLLAWLDLPVAGVAATELQIEGFATVASDYMKAWTERIVAANPKADKQKAGLASAQAWLRAYKRAGIIKPQSASAIKQAAVREAKKSTDKADKGAPSKATAKPEKETPVAPLDGKDAAHQVAAYLSGIEAHIIAALRAGQFSKAAMIVNDLANAK